MGGIWGGLGLHGGGGRGGRQNRCLGPAAITKKSKKKKTNSTAGRQSRKLVVEHWHLTPADLWDK